MVALRETTRFRPETDPCARRTLRNESNNQSSIILHQSQRHYDGLGSVVALSDAAGDTVQLYEYSVYGQVAASDPNHTNPFLFTGRRFDTDTGLYYYRARYYNPYIGRFLQTDPAGDGMNRYAYCRNNPAAFTDPSGLTPEYLGYSVRLNTICWPGEGMRAYGIVTTIRWKDDGDEYCRDFYSPTWEAWVSSMASDHSYTQLFIDPKKSGPGWELIDEKNSTSDLAKREAYWAVRALVETTILPRDALQYLIDRSVHIHALGQVEIENGMRYGGLNRVRWSMNVTGRWSCDAYKKRGGRVAAGDEPDCRARTRTDACLADTPPQCFQQNCTGSVRHRSAKPGHGYPPWVAPGVI